MEHILTTEAIKAQLTRELEAVRGFERNTEGLLASLRRIDPYTNIEHIAQGLRFNQQLTHLHLERASAVLVLLGECREADVTDGDDLEGFIEAL